jgi:hypothetical protein
MNGIEEVAEEGEVGLNTAEPSKVHIRGLNSFSSQQVKQYAGEHYSLDLFGKIQWIDDTSANLIYDTELAATEALEAFSAEEGIMDPLQLRKAKILSTEPNVELFVRQAVASDVKVANAKDHSRYYLIHPEADPDNRPPRKRRFQDNGYQSNKYRRREWEGERRYKRVKDVKDFHEDMYDEDARPGSLSRRNSYPSDGENSRRRLVYDDEDIYDREGRGRDYRGNGDDLMRSRDNGRLRDRSASPVRDDGDGRYGFQEEFPRRRTPQPRAHTPPPANNNRAARDHYRRELFADRRPSSALNGGFERDNYRPTSTVNNSFERDNYRPSSSGSDSYRPSTANKPRELFPDGVGSAHKRTGAKDIDYDIMQDRMRRCCIDGARRVRFADSFTYVEPGARRDERADPVDGGSIGFSFKGAGAGGGFSFKGASRESNGVRELIPQKGRASVNKGMDLFAHKMNGRGVLK